MENIENQLFNKEFRESIQEINNDIAKLNQEFKLQSEQMQHTATEAGKLEQSINKLAKEKENVHKKVELTQQQLAKTKTLYGGNSEEARKLGLELLNLQIAEQNLENAIKQNSDALRKQGEDMLNSSISAQTYTERLANTSNILSGSLGQSSAAWKENSALSQVAGQQYALTEIQLEGMRDQIADIAISLSDSLVPTMMNAIEAAEPFIRKIEEGATAFSNMDEEQGNSISKMGGLVSAVGPAISGLADFITIVDGGGNLVGKLSEFLGGNKGSLIARLGSLSPLGVAGLAVAGLSAVGVAVYNLFKDKSNLNDLSTDTVEAWQDEARELESLADEFDSLRGRTNLTNEEFGRVIELSKKIAEETDPKIIEDLKKEYDGLQDKSGLSATEMENLITANSNLIEQAPTLETTITNTGEKIVDSTDKVRKLIEMMDEWSYAELSIKHNAALENQNQLLEDQQSALEEIEARSDQIGILAENQNLSQSEVNSKLQENETELNKIRERRSEIEQLLADENTSQAEINQLNAEKREIDEKVYDLANEQLVLSLLTKDTESDVLDLLKGEKKTWEDKLDLANQGLDEIDAYNLKMEELLLASVGINEVGEKGLEQLDNKLEKLENEKKSFEDSATEVEKQSEGYRKHLELFDEKIEKHKNVKSQLDTELGLQSEKSKQEEIRLLQLEEEKQHLEDISHGMGNQTEQQEKTNEKVRSGIGLAEDLQDELRKDANKNVDVNDHGTVAKLNSRAGAAITKTVNFRAGAFFGGGIAARYLGFAKGTTHHPGGPSLLGEEGPELVKQGREWFLAHFGLFDLKRGAKVFTAEQTQRMLAKGEAIKGYADGIGNNMIGLLPQGNNESIGELIAEALSRQHISNNVDITINASIRDDGDIDKLARKLDTKLNDISAERRRAWGGV